MFHWLRQLINFFKHLFGINDPKTNVLHPLSPKVGTIPKPVVAVTPPPNKNQGEPPEYRKNDSLFTYREKVFYRVLIQAADNYQVFAKVRLGDLIWIVNKAADNKVHSNQLQCKHIDYVLCDRLSLEPLMAIELDDSSHLRTERHESDELKDRVCAEAELPLLRVVVEQKYEVESIRARIRDKFKNG